MTQLDERITANRQRRTREALLKKLPEHLIAWLDDIPYATEPEASIISRKLFSYAEGQIKEDSIGAYSYIECESAEDALDHAKKVFPKRQVGNAYLFLGDDSPIFVVSLASGVEHFAELFLALDVPVWLASVDMETGVTIDAYGDSYHDCIYQVAGW